MNPSEIVFEILHCDIDLFLFTFIRAGQTNRQKYMDANTNYLE